MVGEAIAVGGLDFESREEGFGLGIVLAVAPPAHGSGDAMGRQLGAEPFAGVLHAAVGVQQQAPGAHRPPRRWTAISRAVMTKSVAREAEKAQPITRLL